MVEQLCVFLIGGGKGGRRELFVKGTILYIYIYIFLGPIFIVPSFGNTMIIVSVYFLEYLVDDEIRMVCGKLVR